MANSASCSASSGEKTNSLLTLYTSEGCSSCPPAERWLQKLEPQTNQVVPLSFHVDYWDYIGWKDRFAKPEYAQRQRLASSRGGSRFVYTPQFILNGRDYRQWQSVSLSQQTKHHNQQAAKAKLSLALTSDDQLQVNATLTGALPLESMHVFVALYESGLETKVQAGENTGKTLKHDYVVRDLFGAYTLNDQKQFERKFRLGSFWNQSKDKVRNAGAVVFMQDKRTGTIIQSLALPFCKG